MEKYEEVKVLGVGNFGVAKLVRDKKTKELVAVKYIPRGEKINENVQREITIHRSLKHPNIIQFKEVFLTPTHLAIAMEYAAGGELFDRLKTFPRRFSEDQARYFFQQMISGVSYCHDMEICHRDLKLENLLLDENSAPRIKICDFGFSKWLHSSPKTTVGTPAYIAPEILKAKDQYEYDGRSADIWSCGVTLYIMVFGAYPFQDPYDRKNIVKTMERVKRGQYSFPFDIYVTSECKQLISRFLISDPKRRIKMEEIKRHPWYLKCLPKELREGTTTKYNEGDNWPIQSLEEIMCLIQEAKKRIDGADSDIERAYYNGDHVEPK